MKKLKILSRLIFIVVLFAASGCGDEDNALAPYSGSPQMKKITIEEGSFKPQITWSGGYASILGVNKGNSAKLDSSLIWLIRMDGNKLSYPVTFGNLPEGAMDMTADYGGTTAQELSEDNSYTYWVMKEKAWNLTKNYTGKVFSADSLLQGDAVGMEEDTINISGYYFVNTSRSIDVYMNIGEVQTYGKLGVISIIPPSDTLGPRLSWEITQQGVDDTKIAAMGLVKGNKYDATALLWEIYSDKDISGKYGKTNVIGQPLYFGEDIPGTTVFAEFASEELKRGEQYYVWIANKDWDQENRLRFADFYAYATFTTW